MSNVEPSGEDTLFDLVYQGATDDSVRTLQKIKGVFVADLSLSVPDVQRILDHAPSTISSAETKDQLEDARKKLSAAGARVLILKRKNSEDAPHGDRLLGQLLPEESEADGDEEAEPPLPDAKSTSSEEFSFEFDLNAEPPPLPAEPRGQRVYTLDLDSTEDVQELVKGFEDQNPPIPEESPPTPVLEIPPPTPATPGTPSSINLLSEDELKAFHLSRGGSLEEPVCAISVEELIDSEDAPTPAEVPLEVHPEQLPPTLAAAEQATAREIALVLEDVSADLESPEPQTKATPTASKPAASKPAPGIIKSLFGGSPATPGSITPAQELDLGLETEIAPSPAASDKPIATTVPTSSDAVSNSPARSVSLSLDAEEAPKEPARENSAAAEPARKSPIKAAPAVTSAQDDSSVEVVPENNKEGVVSAAPPPAPTVSAAAVVATPKRANPKVRTKHWLEMGIPIIAGTLVIGIGNWLYFSPGTQPKKSALANPALVISDEEKSGSAQAPTPIPIKIWEPSLTENTRNIRARISRTDKATILESFSLDTPAPRERTNEEIARGIVLPPWLKRIASGPLQFKPVPQDPRAALSARGPALIYISYAGAAVRLVGRFEATLVPATNSEPYQLSFAVESGLVPEGQDRTTFLLRNKDGTYVASASGSLTFGEALANTDAGAE